MRTLKERTAERTRINNVAHKFVGDELRKMREGDRFHVIDAKNDSIFVIPERDVKEIYGMARLEFLRAAYPRIHEVVCHPCLPDGFKNAKVVEVDEISDCHAWLKVVGKEIQK